jgi:hypothetical protein
MAALVQTNSWRFGSFKVVAASAREPRAFPEGHRTPTLPPMIRDEMLELYAFIFRQGGFHQLGMTFEQFLLVAAAIKPGDLVDAKDASVLWENAKAERIKRLLRWEGRQSICQRFSPK